MDVAFALFLKYGFNGNYYCLEAAASMLALNETSLIRCATPNCELILYFYGFAMGCSSCGVHIAQWLRNEGQYMMAFQILSKAEEDVKQKYVLGEMYEYGEGMDRDVMKAYDLYKRGMQ